MNSFFETALENIIAKLKAVDLQEHDCKKVWQYDGKLSGLVQFRLLKIEAKTLDGVTLLVKHPDPKIRRSFLLTLPLNEEVTLLKKRRGLLKK